jgi:hypothetical protein
MLMLAVPAVLIQAEASCFVKQIKLLKVVAPKYSLDRDFESYEVRQ